MVPKAAYGSGCRDKHTTAHGGFHIGVSYAAVTHATTRALRSLIT